MALENLVNSANPPAILSLSYGECEAANGAALNAAFSGTYQQAAAEGISVFVAAGDEGAASCDAGASWRHPRHRRQRVGIHAIQCGRRRHRFRRQLRRNQQHLLERN